MTARIQIILIDNLDEYHGTVTDIGADGETVVISKNGVVRELHLTKAHSDALDEFLDPYLTAGHQPGAQPEMPPLPGRDEIRRERLKGQGRRREIPGTRDFYRELREWAADAGIKIRVNGKSGGKQNYLYDDVLPAYLAHLAATAAAGRDGGVAAARLDMARLLGLPLPEQPGAADG